MLVAFYIFSRFLEQTYMQSQVDAVKKDFCVYVFPNAALLVQQCAEAISS